MGLACYDNLCDDFIGEPILTKLADLPYFRHELLQTLEELVQLRLLGKHLPNKRSVVRNVIGERSFAVRQRVVKRDGRIVVELVFMCDTSVRFSRTGDCTKKERDRPDGTGINSFRSASYARRLVSYSFVTATTARATSVHRGERLWRRAF